MFSKLEQLMSLSRNWINKMQNQITKQSIEEKFAQYLNEGKNWIGEKKVEWTKVKTFDLTKEAIIFDLGILAFLGAINSLYDPKIWLYLGAGSALLSLLLAFIYVWKISTENINYLQAKYDTIDASLNKLENSYEEAHLHYEKRLNFIEGKLRAREEIWNWVQKISFLLFFLSVAISFIGLII